jgi:hypothetical protein
LLEKFNCARRFEEDPYVSKLGGRSFSLAPHVERARKNDYEHKMRRIDLVESIADVVA